MYSPLYVTTFIRDLLRELFKEYGGEQYSWDSDPKKSKITIGTVNDNHSNARTQQFPRILVQRGPLQCNSQFLSNNLRIRESGGISRGGKDIHRQDIHGSMLIIVEARNEGSCELVGDLVRQFIAWSKLFIETTFGFQAFARQLSVGTCDMDREDTEKFKININIPYTVEDGWEIEGNLTRLNHIFSSLSSD